MNSPKIPKPIPPANPATPAAQTAGGSTGFYSRLMQPFGIFTSASGLTTRAAGQKRSLIGG